MSDEWPNPNATTTRRQVIGLTADECVVHSSVGTTPDPADLYARDAQRLAEMSRFSPATSDVLRDLDEETSQLRLKVSKLEREKSENVAELTKARQKIAEQERLGHIMRRIHPIAHSILKESPEFVTNFDGDRAIIAFVMSIDIRRSTELMLKARTPKQFATFVTTLCAKLQEVILRQFGVFDKFTGDGILAFFPSFYSGPSAGVRAIEAADECHRVFEKHYREHRSAFMAVLKDTGLGIGIDFGTVQPVQVGGELTVVGNPVVYACRMGSAEPGHTLLNQPAYDEVFRDYSGLVNFSETEIAFKHEGSMVAYRVSRNEKAISLSPPPWMANRPAQGTPGDTASGVSDRSKQSQKKSPQV